MGMWSKIKSFLKKVPKWLGKFFDTNADEAIIAILIAAGKGAWVPYIEAIRRAVSTVELSVETVKVAAAAGVPIAMATSSAAKLEAAAAILAAEASGSVGEAAGKLDEARRVIQLVIDAQSQ